MQVWNNMRVSKWWEFWVNCYEKEWRLVHCLEKSDFTASSVSSPAVLFSKAPLFLIKWSCNSQEEGQLGGWISDACTSVNKHDRKRAYTVYLDSCRCMSISPLKWASENPLIGISIMSKIYNIPSCKLKSRRIIPEISVLSSGAT